MNLLFVLLGFLDLLAASLIIFPSYFPFSEALTLYLMIYILAKGFFFILTTFGSYKITLCMCLNIIDIITGLILGSIVIGFPLGVFKNFAFISLIKGVYCFLAPIFS